MFLQSYNFNLNSSIIYFFKIHQYPNFFFPSGTFHGWQPFSVRRFLSFENLFPPPRQSVRISYSFDIFRCPTFCAFPGLSPLFSDWRSSFLMLFLPCRIFASCLSSFGLGILCLGITFTTVGNVLNRVF